MAVPVQRIVAFVDGSNLFGGMADVLKPGEYFEFSEFLSAIEKEIKIDHVSFYGTYMRADQKTTKKAKLLALAQKEFFDSTKDVKKLDFYRGHFSKTSGKEKGVDMHMGIDMAVGACTNTYDVAVIVTGDADLLYAVETAKKFGKDTILACLSPRIAMAMAFVVSHRVVVDLQHFFVTGAGLKFRKRLKRFSLIKLNPKIKTVEVSITKTRRRPAGM